MKPFLAATGANGTPAVVRRLCRAALDAIVRPAAVAGSGIAQPAPLGRKA